MKKLLIALIASNMFMLSALAMAPSQRLGYHESAAGSGPARNMSSYRSMGTKNRIASTQAQKNRKLAHPARASERHERAATKSVKSAK